MAARFARAARTRPGLPKFFRWALRAPRLFSCGPRRTGKRASVTVDVTRTLDGKVVPVEFEFETVSSAGETVGCVEV